MHTKEEQLNFIYEPYKYHTQCPLGRTDQHSLIFGTGDPNTSFMIIGEAPGEQEEKQGIPFVGRSGQLLTKVLNALNIHRENIFITNVVKCRPQNNRTPTPQERDAYKELLFKQIAVIKPKVICALGSVAAQTLLSTTQNITFLRETTHFLNSTAIISTYHPAYILRNKSRVSFFEKDLQNAYLLSQK